MIVVASDPQSGVPSAERPETRELLEKSPSTSSLKWDGIFRPGLRHLHRLQGLLARTITAQRSRRLRVIETVSLGDKRFVSIVKVDGREYLLGGGTTVALLAKLGDQTEDRSFSQAVDTAWKGVPAE